MKKRERPKSDPPGLHSVENPGIQRIAKAKPKKDIDNRTQKNLDRKEKQNRIPNRP